MSTITFARRLRPLAAALTAAALATALLAQPTAATTPTSGSGDFTITFVPTDTRTTGGGNTIAEYTVTGTISGTITGTFTGTERIVMHPDTTANANGVITCVCTVEGKTGTVEFVFNGTSAGTGLPIVGQFTSQNGTLGLSSLHAQGTFSALGTAGTYTVDYHFE
jgi:hypothetical protein